MKLKIGTIALILAGVAVVCIALGSLLIAGSGGIALDQGGGRSIDTERSFPAQAVDTIDLRTVSADISWHEGGGDRIRLHLRGRTNQTANPPVLVAEARGGILAVEIGPRRTSGMFQFDFSRLSLDVYVPSGMAPPVVRIDSASGGIRIEALRAKEFTARTISGDLRADGLISQRTWLHTASGDFRIAGTPGDLAYRGISGDLTLKYQDYGHDLELQSVSGNMHLDLPDESQFNLEASSVSGDIACTFPAAITGGREAHHLDGVVGGGGHQIQARTISGDLSIY